MKKMHVYFSLSKEMILFIASEGLNSKNEGENYPGICPIELDLFAKKKTAMQQFDREGFEIEEYEKIAQDFLNFDSITIQANQVSAHFSGCHLKDLLGSSAVAYGKQAKGTFYKGKKYFPSAKVWFAIEVTKSQFNGILCYRVVHQ